MKLIELSLRQRKILHSIQHSDSFITSREISEKMKISSRTVRNDIHEMNQMLEECGAVITSVQGKGFTFEAKDPDLIRELTRVDNAYFTRAERVRYLSFRLCDSNAPLNLYDLEDEVFVSRTVLLSDIRLIRRKYTYEPPYIRIFIKGDLLSVEQDEEKIRSVLLNMFHEDWDYTIQRNAFYGAHFLDKKLLTVLIEKTGNVLLKYGIGMDDATLSALQLLLAITHYRVKNGHNYPEGSIRYPDFDKEDILATDTLFEILNKQTGIYFSDTEKSRICQFIGNTKLRETGWMREGAETDSFPDFVREEVNAYLEEIKEIFHADFSMDREFVNVLHVFFLQLISGNTMFSRYQDPLAIKRTLTAEYELAFLYQSRALAFIDRFLLEREVCTLALCFSGAIRQYLQLHPEKKLRTMLLSHGNLAEAFGLKRRIMESFSLYLDIIGMAPLNFAGNFDLSDTDLVFMTLRQKAAIPEKIETVYVKDMPGTGFEADEMKIKILSFKKIWPAVSCSLENLLRDAFWHENEVYADSSGLINKMASEFIEAGIAGEEHLKDMTVRENISSFAIHRGLVFVYATIPAKQTKLSAATLHHRIRWNDFKISTVIMAVFRKEDINFLFHMKIRFCNNRIDPELLKDHKTKEELIPLLV